MKLKCVHLSMKSKCVPWWMTSLWKLKNAFSRGAGVGSVRGAGDAHFKFTVFEVRCSWGCAWWACGVRSGESVPRECAARRARGYRETQNQKANAETARVVCSIPPCQSRAATTKDIIFPLRLNKDAIVIVSVRASRVTRLVRAGPITDGAKPHETVKTPGPESSASRTHALHSHSVIE